MTIKFGFPCLLLLLLQMGSLQGQQVRIDIDPMVKRTIGGVSELERTKYFNMHSRSSDAEHQALYDDYQVNNAGRGFWSAMSVAKQRTGQVGEYPSFELPPGDGIPKPVTTFVATDHPYNVYKEGIDIETAAEWAVKYYRDEVSNNDRPAFYEPMNEPFVHARDFYPEPDWTDHAEKRVRGEMARLFAGIGARIHQEPELANMKVIGYSSAYPSMEIKDFSHWESNQKMFMDVAGDDMDGLAIHLYDGINVTGQHSRRSGSNSEAILDLVETYSYIKWDSIKPLAITEYGGIERGYPEGYSDVKSVQSIRSINHLLFNLLERQDRLIISIPFITGKATWHINEANNYQPYGATLWIPKPIGVPLSEVTGWEYTARILFYELWKDVKGERVLIRSGNPDVQAQAFADGNQLFVALNNLDDQQQTVSLNFMREGPAPTELNIRSLRIYPDQNPVFSQSASATSMKELQLIPGETVVLTYTFEEAVAFDNTIQSSRYYNKKYLQTISAGVEMTYEFKGVDTETGYARLRMGIGRKHDRSKRPEVRLNGQTINVPDNWMGYDQADRDDFFGVIDIPLPIQHVRADNVVTIKFPDSGGRLSSLVLEVEKYATAVDQVSATGQKDTLEIRNISPNPFRDQFTIRLPESSSGEGHIAIFDLKGTKVWAEKRRFNGKRTRVNLPEVPAGLYLIHLVTDSKVFVGKVEKM